MCALFLCVYFEMVYGGEKRRNKGLITFSSLKQHNANQWLCTDEECTNCGQPLSRNVSGSIQDLCLMLCAY